MQGWRLARAQRRASEFNRGIDSALEEIAAAAKLAELEGDVRAAERLWNVSRAVIARKRTVPRKGFT